MPEQPPQTERGSANNARDGEGVEKNEEFKRSQEEDHGLEGRRREGGWGGGGGSRSRRGREQQAGARDEDAEVKLFAMG